jgi:hypothetical protein
MTAAHRARAREIADRIGYWYSEGYLETDYPDREGAKLIAAALAEAEEMGRKKGIEEAAKILMPHGHLVVDGDCWYSCPKAGEDYCGNQDRDFCGCGFDEKQEAIRALAGEGK